ncbi:MAG TPA: serine hydrolase domain-containing protein [Tahibacter sp.]|uniref:serine hydrolase domain-containing protein n=1 Tax=Tahibacter sp. TaxID=2056211 RepID=UPI002B7C0815|nr:serine hydrolase domain-containing protein [Tahibacter sp.]HSX61788.1 serine hydrolase domain-containing protein [Tahibacter sp.]
MFEGRNRIATAQARGAARWSLALAAALLTAACATAPRLQSAPPPRATPSGDAVLASLQHGLRPSRLGAGEALPRWSLQERMAHYNVPGVAIALLRDGEVVAARGYGLREAGTQDAVDGDTLFSVGSVSKVVTSAIALRFVADGRLDLDRDVNAYLKSWRIPARPGIRDPHVSLRMLLSHTGGLDVHGFPDFQPDEPMPTLLQILDGTPPAKGGTVRLIHEPGSRYDYSGGGTMVAQLLLEEQAGSPLETVARREVLDPLRMTRSTFANPLPAERGNIAKAHDEAGARVALPRGWESFPEQAASGLWTSANELGRFTGELLKSYKGRGTLLPRPIAQAMMTEVSPSMHGLGPRLHGDGATRFFHHGGDNNSYHAWIEGYLETGDGFVILTNGDGGVNLRGEIRNALSDALGRGVNPVVRLADVDLSDRSYDDYAGRYVRDANIPADLSRGLVDSFEDTAFTIARSGAGFTIALGDPAKTHALLARAPDRFVGDDLPPNELVVHRDAHGKVRGVTIERGNARAYYRRAD